MELPDGTNSIFRVFIVGPTASGKSRLAVELASELGTAVISADSRQSYKMMDIGTGKVTEREMKGVPHLNLSILSPDQEDNAKAFELRAREWEKNLESIGRKFVVYCGGSTMYIRSVLFPLKELPERNEANLAHLELIEEAHGKDHITDMLKSADPEYAARVDGYNRQRIFRALDVWMQTGKPFSSFHLQDETRLPERTIVFGLDWPRQKLYERINARVESMFENGFVEETEAILKSGVSPKSQSLQTVGYRQILEYLKKERSWEETIEEVKTQTRRYAKRQMTYFRRWPFVRMLPMDKLSEEELVKNCLTLIRNLETS